MPGQSKDHGSNKKKKCTTCGKFHRSLKFSTCLPCRRKKKSRIDQRKKDGKCWKCGKNDAMEPNGMCGNCSSAARKHSAKTAARLIKEHRCLRCGGLSDEKPKGGYYRYCADCRDFKKLANTTEYAVKIEETQGSRYARLKAEGKCVTCGKADAIVSNGKKITRCKACNDKMNGRIPVQEEEMWWTESAYIEQALRWIDECLKAKLKFEDDLDFGEVTITPNDKKLYDVSIEFFVGEDEFETKNIKVTIPVLTRESMRVASERAIERVKA